MNINIPIKILTPKIAKNKQDSFFYAGKDIASVKVLNREYVLTTTGLYDFRLKIKGKRHTEHYRIESVTGRTKTLAKKHDLTDTRLKSMTDNWYLVENWGWFGINVWENDTYLQDPVDAYSGYDEAMSAFVELINKDLTGAK
jgi:hypothetical protein